MDDSNVFFVGGAPSSSPTPAAPTTHSRHEERESVADAPEASMEDVVPDITTSHEDDPVESAVDGDVEMLDGSKGVVSGPEELASIEPVNWKEMVFDFELSAPKYPYPHPHRFTISSLVTDILSTTNSHLHLNG